MVNLRSKQMKFCSIPTFCDEHIMLNDVFVLICYVGHFKFPERRSANSGQRAIFGPLTLEHETRTKNYIFFQLGEVFCTLLAF